MFEGKDTQDELRSSEQERTEVKLAKRPSTYRSKVDATNLVGWWRQALDEAGLSHGSWTSRMAGHCVEVCLAEHKDQPCAVAVAISFDGGY